MMRRGLGGGVGIWTLPLAAAEPVVDAYASLLSAAERNLRGRLLMGPVRDRFTVARGALRVLLGRFLACEPASIEFAYGERGKPALADRKSRLCFNLAHSDDLAVYAFAVDLEVGIDVERLREIPEMNQVARRFFALEEVGALESLPAAEQVRSFYLAWTRKEAYVKAVGDGLHTPLDSFCVTLGQTEQARLVTLNGSAADAAAWQLHHLEPAAGYVGALAYRGSRREVTVQEVVDPARLLERLS